MTDTKTSNSEKDRVELAKELARRKANPIKVEKPAQPVVTKPARRTVDLDAGDTIDGATVAASGRYMVTK